LVTRDCKERKLLETPKGLITKTELVMANGMVDENQKENQIWSMMKIYGFVNNGQSAAKLPFEE